MMKHINNFESYLILENILSLIPLNESSEKEVSKSTFSKVLDKVKGYSKKGLITTALLTSLLGSANFTQAQEAQLRQVTKTENQVVNNNDQGLITVTASAKENSKAVEFFTLRWEIKKEKIKGEDVYVGYIFSERHDILGGKPSIRVAATKHITEQGKKAVQNKLITVGKQKIEEHLDLDSELNWVSQDGSSVANFTY
jgi:hypothetical protein